MPQITPISEGAGRKPPNRPDADRIFDEWLVKDDDTDTFAKILVPACGFGPIRPIISGTKRFGTGMYPSWKTGRTYHWEGLAERALIHEAEISPQIVDYEMNGSTLEFTFEEKVVRYTPDQVRQYVDGSVEAIEAKSDQRGFSGAAYGRMLDRAEAILARIRWGFRRVTFQDIVGSERHARNVGTVQSRRFVTVKPGHVEMLGNLRLAGCFVTSCGHLADLFEPDQPLYGMAVVQALMVRRHVHIDLKSTLGPDTAVWILPEPTPFHSTMRF